MVKIARKCFTCCVIEYEANCVCKYIRYFPLREIYSIQTPNTDKTDVHIKKVVEWQHPSKSRQIGASFKKTSKLHIDCAL